MKRNILADIVSYFFILLFLYTGFVKLTEISTFRQQLSSSPLMGSIAGVITWALPIGEILLTIALFTTRWRLPALYVTAGLMTLFTGYVITILLIDDQLTCSCGGIIQELTPKQHVLFNSACVILSLVGIMAIRRQQPTRLFKWLTNSSAIGLLAVIGWSLFTAFTAPVSEKTGLEGRVIPSIPLLLTDSTTRLNTDDIPAGKPFVVIGFDPWCNHCQELTVDIIYHIEVFKDTRIFYITPAQFKNMRTFYRYYQLSHYPNIVMGWDSANILFTYFKTDNTPLIVIFDAKKRLKRVISQQPTATELAQSIEN
ncbi:MauE/DoxX family redox-associated membrane protein [Puia dinghuensis]|uniref:Thioredoxin domain-containing protein n=1 Tax=Puia dinghuensis TaxID=1792502 RepID=A0A8J2UJ76_9BACT|nr:MauE/DoxX family redox-associated membrane protein [Puia dinghuensis]GGB23806.1 hypothetical protein GCM10011511_54610 [Puia dinghuensis]